MLIIEKGSSRGFQYVITDYRKPFSPHFFAVYVRLPEDHPLSHTALSRDLDSINTSAILPRQISWADSGIHHLFPSSPVIGWDYMRPGDENISLSSIINDVESSLSALISMSAA